MSKERCENCYSYLKSYGIDCGKNCDVQDARSKMKKIILQNHPDKHVDEQEKYTELFKKISGCNDLVIKDECMKKNYSRILLSDIDPKFRGNKEYMQAREEWLMSVPPSEVSQEKEDEFREYIENFRVKGKTKSNLHIIYKNNIPGQIIIYKVSKDLFELIGTVIYWKHTIIGYDPLSLITNFLFKLVPYSTKNSVATWFKIINKDSSFEGTGPSKNKRKSSPRRKSSFKGKTQVEKRKYCRDNGLVYDRDIDDCRESKIGKKSMRRRSSRKSPRRKSRKRSGKSSFKGKTQVEKRKYCRDNGLIYDRDIDDCRESKIGKKSMRRRSKSKISRRRRSKSKIGKKSIRRTKRSSRRRRSNKCPSGSVRNPSSGRCVKIGGSTWKKYFN
jgi:hypothetical protein